MNTLCALSFTAFGVLLKDISIIIPNAFGIIVSFIIITVLCILPKEIPKNKEEIVKKDIEIAEISFNKKENNNEKEIKENENEYKSPQMESNYENNIGITDRDQPATL
jgi:hypothetical protein